MELPITLVTILICSVTIANGANILALLNIPSPSIHLWNSVHLTALAERGHNVTVLSTRALKEPVPNHTDIVLEGIYEFLEQQEDYVMEDMSDMSPYTLLALFTGWMKGFCQFSMENKGMKTLMNYPDDFKFDLIIFEPTSGECLLAVVKKFGSPPVVAVSSFSHPHWLNEYIANPNHPAYTPHLFLTYTDHMTFFERLHNVIFYLYTNYMWHIKTLPEIDEIVKRYLGPAGAVPTEELRKISMMFVNTHPSFDYPRPLLPSFIEIAGIHIKEPQPLPKDLQVFLDEAKEGVIYFSLGSNVRSDKLQEDKRRALLEAFAQLPYKVLLKWESDTLPGQPKNVKVGKWLPQKDILAHPNVRLFITHSGLLSTQEAIYRGVPIVGIPFFADQQTNIHKAVMHGVGLKLAYKHITRETVLKAIRTVLDNPSYAKNMQELSVKFRDQIDNPLQRFIFWCEYVIRHKGAHHLRSAAMDLAWYQYLLIDVIVTLVAAILIPILLLCYCCRRMFSRKQPHMKIKKN
ncbi:UDP-glycosyltransferase UGT5 [Anabrus simplex]|uniref:UDP-glycosyltransferase UGT5 n=1 Tax=Anabrus simplex TaxID=316456 RepID=UPI0035A326C6